MPVLFGRTLDWLKTQPDRVVIARRTVGHGEERSHAIELAGMEPPGEEWTFLVVGDTGDSERFGLHLSPQRAVAALMAEDCGLRQGPEAGGRGPGRGGEGESGRARERGPES